MREVTQEDRDAVIQVHDNVRDGTDRLPAYYNYWLSLPEVYAIGLYDGEKMVGFVLVDLDVQKLRIGRTPWTSGEERCFLITFSSHRCVWCGFEPRSGHM